MTVFHRCVGPPGCGKTSYLTKQCKLAAEKYSADAIVVASLTKAAAAEVAGRDTGLPPANVGTLHSHAYHALDRPAICETSASLKEWNEYVGLPSWRVSTKYAVDPENAMPEQMIVDNDGSRLLGEIGIFRQRMIAEEFWPPELRRFWAKWCEWKVATKRMDFTDLIERALTDTECLPQKPQILMLDEAQDMSKLEFALVRHWGESCEQVVIVGDSDQNLYSWRGSDPEAFVTIDEEATVRTLSQSYRVPEAVHAAAVEWIEKIPNREPISYEPRKDEDGRTAKGLLRREPHSYRDPVSLLHAVRRDLDRGKTVMVLASCGYMLTPFIGELKDHGVPFWNPYRVKQGAWNPLRGARRLLAFVKPQPAPVGTEEWWTWGDVWAWLEPMQAKGLIVRGGKTLVENKQQKDRFNESRATVQAPLRDVRGLFLAGDGSLEGPGNHESLLDGDIDWWERNLRHDERKRAQYSLTVARRNGFEVLRQEPQLIVGTIHSVKGGESDVVYLLPDLSGGAYFEGWRPGGVSRDAIIRQFYVGMTRARHELVLCERSSAESVKWL